MSQTVLWVEKSGNIKTGPIPVTYASRSTCPSTCPLKGKCYGEDVYTAMQWRRVDAGEGISWNEHCDKVSALPPDTLWRGHVVGDLPTTGDGIVDREKVMQLTSANRGRRGYTYTHYITPDALQIVREANQGGFVINLSANNLLNADKLVGTGAGPVVVLLPKDAPNKSRTPGGHRVVVCPAQLSTKITCKACGLCAKPDRRFIVGFKAHGTRANFADKLARMV